MTRRYTGGRSRRFALLAALGVAVAVALPLYALGGSDRQVKKAEATLFDQAGDEVGEVKLKQKRDYVEVEARFGAVPTGFHGFHVHASGNCTTGGSPPVPFGNAGGHLNPSNVSHGGHAGDMPVLLVKSDGSAETSFETDRFRVNDLFDADGSAIVVHANADNYANIPTVPYGGPVGATLTTGDAGGRFACGVVEKKGHDDDD